MQESIVQYTCLGEMVQYCIAAGCSNTRNDGVSLFKFPTDPGMGDKWTKEVRKTRDCWNGPTKHSVLCEKHFSEDSFEPDSALASAMGIAKRKRLRPNAVPTLFERPRQQESAVPMQMAETSSIPSGPNSSRKRVAISATSMVSTGSCLTKKPRKAYEKRERSRVREGFYT